MKKQDIILMLSKNWQHIVLIIIAIGITFSGFGFSSKFFSCNKTKPELPKLLKDK